MRIIKQITLGKGDLQTMKIALESIIKAKSSVDQYIPERYTTLLKDVNGCLGDIKDVNSSK